MNEYVREKPVRFSAVGSASSVAFGIFQVRFSGPAHSITNCELLVKGCALGTG